MQRSKKEILYTILAAFFITNAVLGEMTGGKLIQIGPFTMSMGILPWPIVFIATDIINEYFGKDGVRRLTFLTTIMILYAFVMIFVGMGIPASSISPVNDNQFNGVFGQSMWIIVGSIAAFLTSQMVDVFVFWYLRKKTGAKKIWLRATGSTTISQLIDTFIVGGIAFWLPGKVSFADYLNMSATGYVAKLSIAILITPLIYLAHHLIHRYLGETESERIIVNTAEGELNVTRDR
jgi:hypothetical protein